jgi:membrane protease YdiL (CAAX protease family)
MADALLSTVLQAGLALLIAGAAYLVLGRGRGGFGRFTGLHGTPPAALLFGLGMGLAAAALILAVPGVAEMNAGRGTVTGEALHRGASAGIVAGLAVKAVFQTSFSEELLFRGVLGKRLIAWLGFGAGNSIQALLFGAVHLLLLLVPAARTSVVLLLALATAILGWASGWLNERRGGGSILPGWAAHAAANLLAYLAIALRWV